jgi:pimeloyl-ACP methyl ester carboxylesterase
VGWPGLGGTPADPHVTRFGQLVDLVVGELDASGHTVPTHLIAQSMGTVVALRAALAHPERVASLVLVATAGGIDVQRLGASDWREGAPSWHPRQAPRYFFDERSDFSEQIATLTLPVLLVSGDRDPLSPIAVSQRLLELMPQATLSVIAGGDHDLALTHAGEVSEQIRGHLAGSASG